MFLCGLNKGEIQSGIYWTGSSSTYASEMIPVTKEPAVKPAINNIIANVVSPFLSQTKLCCHRKNFIINSLYFENIRNYRRKESGCNNVVKLAIQYSNVAGNSGRGLSCYNKGDTRLQQSVMVENMRQDNFTQGSHFQIRRWLAKFLATENVNPSVELSHLKSLPD